METGNGQPAVVALERGLAIGAELVNGVMSYCCCATTVADARAATLNAANINLRDFMK